MSDFLGIHGTALALREQRLQLLASNIANADTPGFKAQDMDFSSALHAALLVDELQQEVRVFVVDVLDTGFLKAAVLLTGVLLVQTLVGETHFTLLSQLLRTF